MPVASTTPAGFKRHSKYSNLSRFLSKHDDASFSGFITRLDRSPLSAKRNTFLKALFLNTAILTSLALLATLTIIRDSQSPYSASFLLAFSVTQELLIASAILVLLRSTTIPFFLGECRLRIFYGFRPTEIVIRRPPHTVNNDLPPVQQMESNWRMATHALNPELLYSRVGALLSKDYWTLEYATVMDAYKCVHDDEFIEDDLEFGVWKQDNGIWSVCELWRMQELVTDVQEARMFKAQEGKAELISIWQDMVLCGHSVQGKSEASFPKVYPSMVDEFVREGLDYDVGHASV